MLVGWDMRGLSVVVVACCSGLASCGGGETVGEALGYERTGPDELTLIKRPPLIVPPDYNLRPPRAGQPEVQAEAASNAARQTLLGSTSRGTDQIDASERARTTLTGRAPTNIDDATAHQGLNGAAAIPQPDEAGPSAGQSALLSRSNRVERDLSALVESRAENRIDGDLLRRLLAWKPPSIATQDGAATAPPGQVIQVVRRAQTPINKDSLSE